jgi:hypothetical protein
MKLRAAGALVVLALVGATSAALAATDGHAKKAESFKLGVSLAGYSTDFWSSYVSYETSSTCFSGRRGSTSTTPCGEPS